jgi:arylsulfatase A-like enzyme
MKKQIILPLILTVGAAGCTMQSKTELPLPNVLWVSVEDITTLLGCYGDANASTPNLDAFAKRSVLFSNAFATAPSCAPSRSTIITGINSVTLGTQRLRSEISIPAEIKPYPKFLKEAGYFVTNNSKEDYNFRDTTIWNLSSGKAHWRMRNENQPFFSIFNLGQTHQSGIFGSDSVYAAKIKRFLPYIKTCNPDSVVVPPYYPNTPELRKHWARYYTNVSIIDYQFGEILKELETDSLTENTIVVFFSDHGTGVPRGKRSLYDSGLKIPLIVHVPDKYQKKYGMKPGTTDDRMVTFIDFAPTMLDIAGVEIPSGWLGKPFIPGNPENLHQYTFGISDRLDEAFEVARTLRTPEYRYIRNFIPQLPLIQPNFYTDQSEIMKALNAANREMELNEVQSVFFRTRRTAEELYDVKNDPHQIHNLAGDPAYNDKLVELRGILLAEVKKNFDTGLMPEPEMLRLSGGRTPYEAAHDPQVFPIDEILEACNLTLEPELQTNVVLEKLRHSNGLVRFWTVMAVQERGLNNQEVNAELRKLLNDSFPTVQIEAAKTLVKLGNKELITVIIRYVDGSDSAMGLYASRAYQEVSILLPRQPEALVQLYKKLAQEMNDRKNHTQYYKLYSYWALYPIFEPGTEAAWKSN